MQTSSPPPSTLWGEHIAAELHRAGLRHAVISPGSRSTPLTLAFTGHGGFRAWLQIDERSAAFFALGMAQTLNEPVALVCTSGTAAAEYFPAVVEAGQNAVPLLLLTADRPPELRDSGANQTIDQRKLYGGHVRWEAELPLPEAHPSPRTLRALWSTLDRALAIARGAAHTPPGPVHLNLPFRKPLEPATRDALAAARAEAAAAGRGGVAWTRFAPSRRLPSPATVETFAALLNRARCPLIVAGPRCPREATFRAALRRLAQAIAAPLLADPLSNLRFGMAEALGGYDWGLEGLPAPDLVLRFGAMPTSKTLLDWLENLPPEIPQIGVEAHGRWQDGGFTLRHFFAADPTALLEAALPHITPRAAGDWPAAWQAREAQVQAALEAAPSSEGRIVREIVAALPEGTHLFLANSLPVRHADAFAAPSARRILTFGNRGASGIDGTLSSAAGMAAAAGAHPAILLTGDLSLLHDVNGFLLLKRYNLPLKIVLLDNNGGGIFHRLPVARHDPPFGEWFLTPPEADLTAIARAYGVAGERVPAGAAGEALRGALKTPGPRLLHFLTEAAQSESVRVSLIKRLSFR